MRSIHLARIPGYLCLILAVISLGGCASNPKIMYDYDRSADFGSYHTYNLMDGAGPDYSNYVSFFTTYMIEAIEIEMEKRGYVKSRNPDLLVNFNAVLNDKTKVTQSPAPMTGGYADLIEIAREIRRGSAGRVAPLSYLPESLEPKPLVPLGDLVGRHYLRVTALDRAGVLARIAGVLGDLGIGIESLLQKGRGGAAESVPVVMLTHAAKEWSVQRALEAIAELPDVTAPTRLIRIEEGL